MSLFITDPAPARRLFRDIFKGSGIYLIGFIVQRLASLFVLPITTRYLTPADYGVSDLLEQTTSVVSLLFGANLAGALGYFYFEAETDGARRRVVSTTVLGMAILGALAGAALWPLSGFVSAIVFRGDLAKPFFRIIAVSLPAGFALESVLTLYRVENRPVAYTTASFARLGLQISGIIVLVAVFRLRITGMVYAYFITVAVLALALCTACFRRIPPTLDFRLFGRMLRWTVPLCVSGLAMLVINFGDRFLLPHYRPLGELGIYILAYKFGMLLSIFFGSFGIYWGAQVFNIMRRTDADFVFARVSTYVVLGLSFCAIGIIVCAPPAIRLLAAPAFRGAAAVIPVIVVAYYVRAIGDFIRCLFLAEGRPSHIAACNFVGAGACVAGYAVLIPRYGMWGAAYATLAAFVLTSVLSAVWVHRLAALQG